MFDIYGSPYPYDLFEYCVHLMLSITSGRLKRNDAWSCAGYLNNPEATANTIDKDGFLHTGDVAFIDEDEEMFIVDRVKEIIKFKGFQVPPAELEALLLSNEEIQHAAVVS